MGPAPKVLVYLATAAPIEHAEAGGAPPPEKEPAIRCPSPTRIISNYLASHRADSFVLAIPYVNPRRSRRSAARSKKMEEETGMMVGQEELRDPRPLPAHSSRTRYCGWSSRERRSPPTRRWSSTCIWRGLPFPEREVEFRVKELTYQGKLEM